MPYDPVKDLYDGISPGLGQFGIKSRAVTPHDTNDLDLYAKTVTCLTAGNLAVIPKENGDAAGDVVAYIGVPAGFSPPFQVRRVLATGTTCTVRTVD